MTLWLLDQRRFRGKFSLAIRESNPQSCATKYTLRRRRPQQALL